MNRLLILAALLLITVIFIGQSMERRDEDQRILKSELHRLPGNAGQTVEMVREIRIERADTAWTYRLKNGNWHYPAYENAFALNDRVKSFVKDLVESHGTIVATRAVPFYGFETNPIRVQLTDSTGSWQQTIEIGASVPGADTREAYMKIPESDTLYHMHADPVKTLDYERLPNRPPFLDPKILPSALVRRAIKQVVYRGSSLPIKKLFREEIEVPEDKKYPTDGPTYQWFADLARPRQKVVNTSVYAYLGFLSRIKYSAIQDPSRLAALGQYLILIDDQDTADTLEVGALDESTALLRHRTTGHVYAVSPIKATLLFPTMALLDSLRDPNPYQVAEPTGPFSLASP